jgi:acyl-coenzyme A thioesterase PaaI-like protein
MANGTLDLWRRLSGLPGGKYLFSRLVCFKAPYFSSIRPRFSTLEPGAAELRIRKRRAVLNHIGTVHAIAGGTMTEVTVPPTHRWIPKGMTVRYLRKAVSDLQAVARPLSEMPANAESAEYTVRVDVLDEAGETVFSADIVMWISPRQAAKKNPAD